MTNDITEIITEAVKRAVNARPVPPHVNIKQAGEMMNCSPYKVRELIKAGKLKLNGAGLIPTADVWRVVNGW